MLSPTLLGVIICVTAVILEGALAGKGCSSAAGAASHAALFPSIRTLACYRFPVLCDVLRHFAPHAHRWACVALAGFCPRADDCAPTRKRALERAVLSVARSACELHCIRALCGARRHTGHPSRQDISSRRHLAFVLPDLSYLCYSMGLSFIST
jgi:hypothetical protein